MISPEAQEPEDHGVTLEEIADMARSVLPPLEEPDAGGETLGRHAHIWRWLAAAQNLPRPEIRHPRIALFMARHGAFPDRQETLDMALGQLNNGSHRLCALAQEANADLQVYELGLDSPPRDFRREISLLAHEAAHAASYGLMAVQPGIDLLVAGCLNPVANTAGAEVLRMLGTGAEAFDALSTAGGLDIAALLGALIAARLAHIPVVLDGEGAIAAAAVLEALHPGAAAHTKSADEILGERLPSQPGMAGALLIAFLKSLAKAG